MGAVEAVNSMILMPVEMGGLNVFKSSQHRLNVE
jgi:hypothetical protein